MVSPKVWDYEIRVLMMFLACLFQVLKQLKRLYQRPRGRGVYAVHYRHLVCRLGAVVAHHLRGWHLLCAMQIMCSIKIIFINIITYYNM